MKRQTVGLVGLLAVLAAGCWQKSVHPFFTTQDLAPDPKLVGSWKEQNKNGDANAEGNVWTFTQPAADRFQLTISDANTSHRYDAFLFKLDQHRLLDLLALDRPVSSIPAHHLFRVDELGPVLRLSPLNASWIRDWLQKNPDALPHLRVVDPEHREDRDKDEIVLTGDTKELQKFIREHVQAPDFFAGSTELKRE